jgi:hypothetical protein
MRNEKVEIIIGFLLFALLGTLLSCATDKTPLQIENSLPQSKLEYYNDAFDKMREDLWDRAGYLYREEQVQNFKQADLRFESGKLIIRTKTGSFSKAGLGSKYVFRGDFDFQLHCRLDFIKGITRTDVDQVFALVVIDNSQKFEKPTAADIGLFMKGGIDQGYLFSNGYVNGRRKKGDRHKTDNFNGWLRILRTGKSITTLYKKGGTLEWTQMNTFHITDKDMLIGFSLRNFYSKRTTIRATYSVTAEFDHFKINAAQEIIEEEI